MKENHKRDNRSNAGERLAKLDNQKNNLDPTQFEEHSQINKRRRVEQYHMNTRALYEDMNGIIYPEKNNKS